MRSRFTCSASAVAMPRRWSPWLSTLAPRNSVGPVTRNPSSRASIRVREGQAVSVHEPDPVPADPQPESIPLTIVHEDESLVVVDKPAGVPSTGRP